MEVWFVKLKKSIPHYFTGDYDFRRDLNVLFVVHPIFSVKLLGEDRRKIGNCLKPERLSFVNFDWQA